MINYSLVLSGGGALGIAQLGYIHTLETQNIKFGEIIGTSIGAVIGACLSIGLSSHSILTLFSDFSNVLGWIKLSTKGNSISSDEKIKQILFDIFGDMRMKDTLIPLKVITTNLNRGYSRVFNNNDDIPIVTVLLASMAIPGVFQEQLIDGDIHVDGFLAQNLGVKEISLPNAIAIDVLGEKSYKPELPSSYFKTVNVLSMTEKSMRILILTQTRNAIDALDEGINLDYVDIPTSNFQTYSFGKFQELFEIGKSVK